MIGNLLRGAIAGAAGATALNAVAYADMVLRARPASSSPRQAVEKLAERTGWQVPGEGEERDNRLDALGALGGIAVGVGVGAAAGLLRPLVRGLPAPLGSAVLGAAAMAGSDVPLATLGLTDVSTWSASDWFSDALPHLAYGAVAFRALR